MDKRPQNSIGSPSMGTGASHSTPAQIHRLAFGLRPPMSSQPSPIPSSADLARYLEQRGELGKPWMWHLLRLSKLQEAKNSMDPDTYLEQLHQAHTDLMRLGNFWEGREEEVFTGRYRPSTLVEPLPGSPEDR